MEDRVIEYKRELTKDVDGLEREVVSFLNTYGGELLFGVNNDGTVYGIEDIDTVPEEIALRLDSNIQPSCLGLYDIRTEKLEDKNIVRVVVSAGFERPYHLAKYDLIPDGCYYRSKDSSCQQMPEDMIAEMFASSITKTLSLVMSPDQNLTFQVLEIYYRNHGHRLEEGFARKLDFLTPSGKYNFIAYLFSDNNHLTFKVAKYAGTDKCNLIECSEYGFCCLLLVADRILNRLHTENRTWTKITEKFRLEKHMYGPESVKEAVINMLINNDYVHGCTPVVELFSDRLELTSIGGLPEGLSEDDFFGGISMPRNREILRVFRDVGMVKHFGSCPDRILKDYDRSVFTLGHGYIRVSFRYAMRIDD